MGYGNRMLEKEIRIPCTKKICKRIWEVTKTFSSDVNCDSIQEWDGLLINTSSIHA